MNILDTWLQGSVPNKSAPLFLEQNLVVEVFIRGKLKKLRRHPDFDELVISTVENGLLQNTWEGMVYIMNWKLGGKRHPLYIGKAEKRGVTRPLSFNLANIRTNQHAFARWGYGLAYHIGDLSHAIFGGQAYKKPSPKYRKWAEKLFVNFDPPTLRRKVYVTLISWHQGMKGPSGLVGSVASVEKEIIALASVSHPDALMNVDGR
jgi:hypothetical protein